MNKEQLLILMKEWLRLSPDEDVTLLQLLGFASSHEKWKVDQFYIHFAPLMAQVIDGDL